MIKTNSAKIRREELMQCDFGRVVFSLPGEARWRAISGRIHWIDGFGKSENRDEIFFEKTTTTLKQFVFREFAVDGLFGFIEGESREDDFIESLLNADDWKISDSRIEIYPRDTETLKSDFIALVNKIIAEIRENEFLKIVAARKENVLIDSQGLDWISTLQQLRNSFPNAMVFALKIGDSEIWLGCTPEKLLVYDGSKAKVHALAGTLTKNQVHSWTEKEKLEQQVTHDFVGNLLQAGGIEEFAVSAVSEVAMGDIKHLASEYTFPINYKQVFQWANQLHPTPAVGGWPQEKAWNWIDDFEGFDREFYAGWLGYLDQSQQIAQLFVTLRCGKWDKNGLNLYAGGGINLASDPEIEWAETAAKMNIIQSAIVKK